MSKPAIVATTLLAVFGGGQPVFTEEAISEPGCVCGLSTDAGVLNAGRPTFSDPPMRLRTNAIPGSRATLERRKPCRDTIAAPPLRMRDRPLTRVSRARIHHGANQHLA
jgi:hypothetical protein